MTKHTLSNFEEALTELKSSVSKMGGLAEKLCQDGLSAFISSNVDMIKNCNEQDKIIDEAERSINQQTFRLLALQAPMAIDLRKIITSLQIASCLERCGDYGRNLARRSDLGLSEASPSVFLGVPRIWTKFQQGVLNKIPQKKLNVLLSIPFISSLIKKKIKSNLGLSNANNIFTGAAPTPVSTIEWFKKLGIIIQEAYAMTENTCYSHVSFKDKLLNYSV